MPKDMLMQIINTSGSLAMPAPSTTRAKILFAPLETQPPSQPELVNIPRETPIIEDGEQIKGLKRTTLKVARGLQKLKSQVLGKSRLICEPLGSIYEHPTWKLDGQPLSELEEKYKEYKQKIDSGQKIRPLKTKDLAKLAYVFSRYIVDMAGNHPPDLRDEETKAIVDEKIALVASIKKELRQRGSSWMKKEFCPLLEETKKLSTPHEPIGKPEYLDHYFYLYRRNNYWLTKNCLKQTLKCLEENYGKKRLHWWSRTTHDEYLRTPKGIARLEYARMKIEAYDNPQGKRPWLGPSKKDRALVAYAETKSWVQQLKDEAHKLTTPPMVINGEFQYQDRRLELAKMFHHLSNSSRLKPMLREVLGILGELPIKRYIAEQHYLSLPPPSLARYDSQLNDLNLRLKCFEFMAQASKLVEKYIEELGKHCPDNIKARIPINRDEGATYDGILNRYSKEIKIWVDKIANLDFEKEFKQVMKNYKKLSLDINQAQRNGLINQALCDGLSSEINDMKEYLVSAKAGMSKKVTETVHVAPGRNEEQEREVPSLIMTYVFHPAVYEESKDVQRETSLYWDGMVDTYKQEILEVKKNRTVLENHLKWVAECKADYQRDNAYQNKPGPNKQDKTQEGKAKTRQEALQINSDATSLLDDEESSVTQNDVASTTDTEGDIIFSYKAISTDSDRGTENNKQRAGLGL